MLTHLLADVLVSSTPSRIVNVAAKAYDFIDGMNFDDIMNEKDYQGWNVYCRSKLANILFARELARRLQGTRSCACNSRKSTAQRSKTTAAAIFQIVAAAESQCASATTGGVAK